VSPVFCCAAAGRFAVTAAFVILLLFFGFCCKLPRALKMPLGGLLRGLLCCAAVLCAGDCVCNQDYAAAAAVLFLIFPSGNTTKIFLIPTCAAS
jgi:hypothetical protein